MTGAAPVASVSDNWVGRFYGSTIGRKFVMAVTGIILVGFITIHMSGNLLIHRGPDAMNHYAAFLKGNAPLLWGTRIIVLLATVFHIHSALTLTRRAATARPERYSRLSPQVATWSSRMMRIGGVLLAVFLVFHILHFTTGTVLAAQFVEGDVYQNVVRSFSITWVAAFYLIAMGALSMHLHHGVWSLFQTLGANHPHLEGWRRKLAWFLSIAIPIGFASVPLAIIAGMVR